MARKCTRITGVRRSLMASKAVMINKVCKTESETYCLKSGVPKNPGSAAKLGLKACRKADTPSTKTKKARPHIAAKLRPSITAGTVLIILAGRFRGKRVVFLKQLASGLLLVTGPYKVNGVPLTRVNQAYVIATSTRVDVSSVEIGEELTDDAFKAEKTPKKKPEFVPDSGMEVEKKTINPVLKEMQKKIDSAVVSSVKKVPMLSSYLGSLFSLSKGEAPHTLKF